MMNVSRRVVLASMLLSALVMVLGGCGSDETEFTQSIKLTSTISLAGQFEGTPGEPSPMAQEVEIFIGSDFFLGESNPGLKEKADNDLFTNMSLLSFEYNVETNTLGQDLNNIEVAIGPLGSQSPNAEDTVLVGVIETLKAQETGTFQGTLQTENVAALSQHIYKLDFAMSQGIKLRLEAGDIIPTGLVKFEAVVVFVLTSDDE